MAGEELLARPDTLVSVHGGATRVDRPTTRVAPPFFPVTRHMRLRQDYELPVREANSYQKFCL